MQNKYIKKRIFKRILVAFPETHTMMKKKTKTKRSRMQ
jgi:hypothetical protein